MCGISSIVNKRNQKVSHRMINSMNEKIIHRGPDDDGVFTEGNIGLGHRRLSIIDLSSAGHQPMEYWNNVIVYNGEVYNYVELKNTLNKKGYEFKTSTDTEVILAAYDYWGEDCVKKFNGMWAFALYDRKKNILFCSRDRFGIKPFCYANTNHYFFIASEAKQIISNNFIHSIPNLTSIYEFLVNNALNNSKETFFSGIEYLLGGHNLVYDLAVGTFEIKKWYSIYDNLGQKTQKNINFKEASSIFLELFTDSVKLRMRSDVQVGACLSGGLDSSSIVASVFSNQNSVSTISSCYHDKKYDEQEFIDEVTKATNFNSFKVFPSLSDLYEKNILYEMSYHQDQPIKGASQFSEYKVFQTAKQQQLTVMLDGQGSDEYLAGYADFFNHYFLDLLKSGQLLTLISEMNYKALYTPHWNFLNVMLNFIRFNQTRSKHKQPALPNNWLNPINRVNLTKKIVVDNIRDLSKQQISTSRLSYQLHSEDRNSMLHSIESRLPFLDYRLVEFVINLPDKFKIKQGKTKALLREGMKNILPQKILNRTDKMGFVAPDAVWLRQDSELIRKKLIEATNELSLVINSKIVDDFDLFIANKKPFDGKYMRVLSLHEWSKAFNVQLKA